MQALQLLQLLLQLLRLRRSCGADHRRRTQGQLAAWLWWRYLLCRRLLPRWLLLQECLQLWQCLQQRQRERCCSRRCCSGCWQLLRRSILGMRSRNGVLQGLCLLSGQAASQQGGCSRSR